MKKTLLIAAMGLATLGLSSCNDDSDNSTNVNVPIPAYNIVTETGGPNVSVSLCYYTVTLTMPDCLMTIGSENVRTTGASTVNFQTIIMPYKASMVEVDGTSREDISFKSAMATGSGAAVTDLSGTLTQAVYMPEAGLVPGYDILLPAGTGHHLYASYTLNGSYAVRTFWPDQTFRGSTMTTFPNQTDPFETDGIYYRVVMKRNADNSLGDKADVIFYNAKFAPAAPVLKAIVLKDLDLKFSSRGYEVSGTEIVPQVLMDGGVLTDNRTFTFDKFEFNCGGDMTSGVADYEVAGKYKGSFNGSCMPE